MPKTLKGKRETKNIKKDYRFPRPTPYSVNSHITECSSSNSIDIR